MLQTITLLIGLIFSSSLYCQETVVPAPNKSSITLQGRAAEEHEIESMGKKFPLIIWTNVRVIALMDEATEADVLDELKPAFSKLKGSASDYFSKWGMLVVEATGDPLAKDVLEKAVQKHAKWVGLAIFSPPVGDNDQFTVMIPELTVEPLADVTKEQLALAFKDHAVIAKKSRFRNEYTLVPNGKMDSPLDLLEFAHTQSGTVINAKRTRLNYAPVVQRR